jgi:hypothetical protein
MNTYMRDLCVLEAESIANQIFYMIVPSVKQIYKVHDNAFVAVYHNDGHVHYHKRFILLSL